MLSGAIFNLVFTFVSFSVLWFQPADDKSFFISLLIAAGAWWTNLIAQTIDKAKLAIYGDGFKQIRFSGKLVIIFDMILRIIAVIIGLFLFWLSLMGTMGFFLTENECIVVANAEDAITGFLKHTLPAIPLNFLFWANIIVLVLSALVLLLQPILEIWFYSQQQYKVLSHKIGIPQ